MGQYYLIKDVKRGNEWSNTFGNFQSYSLSLEGMGEPVSLNKAVPVKDEPEAGQKLYGTVEMLMSQKGTSYYKFKTEKVPDGGYTAPATKQGSDGSYEGHSDKEDSIARAVALKAAVELVGVASNDRHELPEDGVLAYAEVFLAWLKNESSGLQGRGEGEVKTSDAPPAANEANPQPAATIGYQKAQEARAKLTQDPEVQSLMEFAEQNQEDIEGSWRE